MIKDLSLRRESDKLRKREDRASNPIINQRRRERYANDPIYRAKISLHKYGITPEQYNSMLQAQGGVCAICKLPCKTYERLGVDHCHETKKIRGLLCLECNRGIGALKDDPALLDAAAAYLRST